MLGNKLKGLLTQRQPTFGTWMQLGEPGVGEILANAGFDWLVVDCEHTDIDVHRFTNIARGLAGRDAVPLVRVRQNSPLDIRQMLDAGAQGVIVPLVNTAAEARRAVSAAKYPPDGIRGFAFCRCNEYGISFASYAAEANRQIVVLVMIESRQAVENIEEILAVGGIDGVFIGPYDLSGSYGRIGQTAHAEIRRASERVVDACRKAGKAAGIHLVIPDPEATRRAVQDGFTFIALGMDDVFLDRAARSALQAATEVVRRQAS